MSKLKPKTVKWLTKQMNHKKWGQYRCGKVGKKWVVEKWCRPMYSIHERWSEYENFTALGGYNNFYIGASEILAKEKILGFRADAITKYCKKQRARLNYSKRKWKYIP
jgi:hypothetical protein